MIKVFWHAGRLATLTAAVGMLVMSFGTYAHAQGTNVISLDEALAKALQSSPRLEASSAAIRASAGEQRQAGAWQNPQLTFEAENFSGDGPYRGYSGAETTVGVSQLVELSGKARRRAAVAKEGVTISQFDHDIEALSLISDVRTAYANAVAAQERFAMRQEQRAVAERLYGEVSERVNAAREPSIQKSKAEITLSTATFAAEKSERELNHAKHVLSSLWGGHKSEYGLQSDYFYIVEPPMAEEAAEEALEKNMYLKRMTAEQLRAQAVHRLELVQAVPDPTIGIAVRDFRNTGDRALVASVAIPIPVLNHNRGGIDRARENITKAASDAQAVRLLLVNQLHEALEEMKNTHDNANNLKKTILPAAEKAFSESRKGYNAGKFAYIEVLDAQRTLFDVKEQYIDTLNEYHQAKATLERLTATGTRNQIQESKKQ
jgi:cobalt-zinc-cadmium efflux system outer membrane protein